MNCPNCVAMREALETISKIVRTHEDGIGGSTLLTRSLKDTSESLLYTLAPPARGWLDPEGVAKVREALQWVVKSIETPNETAGSPDDYARIGLKTLALLDEVSKRYKDGFSTEASVNRGE